MPENREPAYLYLTTTGRCTGEPREIELWFTRRDGRYYVIAEFAHSQWVRNLQADPRVLVRLEDGPVRATARMLDPASEPELNSAVQQLSREKYGWGEGIVVELTPET